MPLCGSKQTPSKNKIVMRTTFLFLSITLLGLASCDMKYDYSVRVQNLTSEPIKVAFKSLHDRSGTVEKNIIIAPGDGKIIIQTTNLPNDNGWRGNKNLVAEYIHAYKTDDTKSHLDWNSEKIKLERVDIGQAEYYINYTEADF